jgi:hypothetical protein
VREKASFLLLDLMLQISDENMDSKLQQWCGFFNELVERISKVGIEDKSCYVDILSLFLQK